MAKVRHMEHMSSTYMHCEHVTCLVVLCRVPASCEVSHVNTAAGRHYSLPLQPQDLILEHCTEVTGVAYVRTYVQHCIVEATRNMYVGAFMLQDTINNFVARR